MNFSSSGGDYKHGHGTHVAGESSLFALLLAACLCLFSVLGTLAGFCSTETDVINSNMNSYHGMAPDAKIAFFDIGELVFYL